MQPLPPAATGALQSVYGFIGSSDYAAAAAEFDKLAPELRGHPAVLTARMSLHQAMSEWDPAIAIAERLIAAEPRQPVYWLQRSLFLHESGRIQEAWERLLPAAVKFPRFWIIPYSLACYECRLGKLPEARQHFNDAMQLVDVQVLMAKALAEPDLQPLWPEIRTLRSAPN